MMISATLNDLVSYHALFTTSFYTCQNCAQRVPDFTVPGTITQSLITSTVEHYITQSAIQTRLTIV